MRFIVIEAWVALFASAWIETSSDFFDGYTGDDVALFASAWIETPRV